MMPTLHAAAAHAGVRAAQQRAHRVGHLRHRLVGRKALKRGRHRVDRNERAAGIREEADEERDALGRLRRAREDPDRRRKPRQPDHVHQEDGQRREPAGGVAVRPEPDRKRDHEHDRGGNQVPEHAGDHMAVDQRHAADIHRAQAVDHASGEIPRHGHGRGSGTESDADEQHAGNDVVDVAGRSVDRASEEVDEHQHQQDGQRERRDQGVGVPQRESQGADDQRPGFDRQPAAARRREQDGGGVRRGRARFRVRAVAVR